MNGKVEEMIKRAVEALGADGYERGIPWNGYDVYVPQYDCDPVVGFPYVVLVGNGEVRISAEEEALEYLDYSSKEGRTERAKPKKKETVGNPHGYMTGNVSTSVSIACAARTKGPQKARANMTSNDAPWIKSASLRSSLALSWRLDQYKRPVYLRAFLMVEV